MLTFLPMIWEVASFLSLNTAHETDNLNSAHQYYLARSLGPVRQLIFYCVSINVFLNVVLSVYFLLYEKLSLLHLIICTAAFLMCFHHLHKQDIPEYNFSYIAAANVMLYLSVRNVLFFYNNGWSYNS